MTFLTAARCNADGAVAYYPGSADNHIEEAAAVSIPMIVHLGEEDEFISKDAQQKIRNAFASNSEVKIFSYLGCSHAFPRQYGRSLRSVCGPDRKRSNVGFLRSKTALTLTSE
jgi:carboxymethylenebutenolidase